MIKRQTLTSQVFDHILNLVKSGQVKPGEKLPTEKQLTAELGVSRTCVREAVKSLESLRVISVRPRVGAVVLELSPSAVFNAESLSAFSHSQATDVLIEFRKIVEVGLASLAAEKATGEDLAAMLRAMEVRSYCLPCRYRFSRGHRGSQQESHRHHGSEDDLGTATGTEAPDQRSLKRTGRRPAGTLEGF